MNSLYIFDSNTGKYRYRDGKRGFVKGSVVDAFATRIAVKAKKEFAVLLGLHGNGVALAETLSNMADLIAHLELAVAGLYSGGLGTNPTINDTLDHVEQQRDRLIDAFKKHESGESTKQQLTNSLNRYLEDAVTSGKAIARHSLKIRQGETYCYRTLGDAEHCLSCTRYSLSGVQKTADLPPPGLACECTSRCKCSAYYFKSFESAVAARKRKT